MPLDTPTQICKQCGNTFVEPGGRPKGRMPFCREKCYRISLPKREGTFTCLICGNTCRVRRFGASITCSQACYKRYWYLKNKERLDTYRGEWSKANGEKQRAYKRRSISKKPTHYLAMSVTYAEARRARELMAGGSHTTEEWLALLESTGYKCLGCGLGIDDVPLARDHVVPVSRGGSNDISNIQPLCRSCNSRKGTNSTDYRTPLEDTTMRQGDGPHD